MTPDEIHEMERPYSEVVGTLKIDQPYTKRENSEFAAWFTDYQLEAGEYPLRCAKTQEGYPTLFAEGIPAEVVNEDNQSRLHGVPSGSNDPSSIGKKTTQMIGVGQIHVDGGGNNDGISVTMDSDLVVTQDHGYHRLHFNQDSPDYEPFMANNALHQERQSALRSFNRMGSMKANEAILKNALDNDLLSLESIAEIQNTKDKNAPMDLDLHKVMAVDYSLTRKTGQGLKAHGLGVTDALSGDMNLNGKGIDQVSEQIIEANGLEKSPVHGRNQQFDAGM